MKRTRRKIREMIKPDMIFEFDTYGVSHVYIDNGELIITGQPQSNDEFHNCDYMGCSTFRHVIFRGRIKDFRVGAKLHRVKR